MLILTSNTKAELMVKNSRFLSEAIAIREVSDAKDVWRAQKEKYGCSHIVYAFIAGPQGNVVGCSDDGEPSGTAGRPTLEVLKGSGITNVILTTARWFGGTLLGTGGLVHAYTACAQAALENAQTTELVSMSDICISVTYGEYDALKRLFAEFGVQVVSEEFASEIGVAARICESQETELLSKLTDLTRGRIKSLR